MTVGEIAVRNEVRQILNEAGINKNTVLDMAINRIEDLIDEAVTKKINQLLSEDYIERKVNAAVNSQISSCVQKEVKEQIDQYRIKVEVVKNTDI